MNINLEKGNRLERAVHLIESVMLKSNPNLKNNPFVIENKKPVIIDGVRHEIDVYVEIDLGDNYKSIFIFECKNWKDPVGKNEIIIFTEIIRAVGATKGIFIANYFGRYAKAQAKKDNRIELISATDELSELIHFPVFCYFSTQILKEKITFDFGNPEKIPSRIQIESIVFNNESMDFRLFASNLAQQIIDEKAGFSPPTEPIDGDYPYEAEVIVDFSREVLLVNGKPVKEATVYLKFIYILRKARILSKFDIETRGKIIEYEFINISDSNIGSRVYFIDKEEEGKSKITLIFPPKEEKK